MEGQVVQGSERVLANGARGHLVHRMKKDGTMGTRFVIHTGASAEYMNQLRAKRFREISADQAKQAFEKHFTVGKKYKSPGSALRARSRDLHYAAPVRTNTTYLRNPGKWDYPGLDLGDKQNKPATPAQLEALARGRAKSAANRAARRSASPTQVGGYWW